MKTSHPLLVKFCWGWIILISVVTILHSTYRSWLIAQGLSGNEVQNLLNPNQWNDPEYVKHALISYLHIIPAVIIYLLGPIQFIDKVRKQWKKIHKWSGYVFILVVITSGFASIFMGIVFPVGGTSETASSILFSTVMIFCVCRALYFVLKRRIDLHREWMMRGYMIALGPGTMHFIIPLFIQVGGKDIGEALSLSLWLGFTIHLMLAEVWIRSSYPQNKTNRRETVPADARENMRTGMANMPLYGARYEIHV